MTERELGLPYARGARVQPWENMVICGSEIVDLEGFFH